MENKVSVIKVCLPTSQEMMDSSGQMNERQEISKEQSPM